MGFFIPRANPDLTEAYKLPTFGAQDRRDVMAFLCWAPTVAAAWAVSPRLVTPALLYHCSTRAIMAAWQSLA